MMLRGVIVLMVIAWTAPAFAKEPVTLEGAWTTSTLTPYARPPGVDQLVMSAAEAAAYEHKRRGKPPDGAIDEVGGEDTDWWETDVSLARVRGQARSSWIVSPADGRVPFTRDAQAANRARQARAKSDFSGPEVRPDGERCLATTGPPLQSFGANDGFRILQTASAVAIVLERTSGARIVRLNGAAHAHDNIRTRDGDSIGWWEGSTLVIDTRNFSNPTITAAGEDRSKMRVIERLTRIGPKELHYAFFLTNPARYASPIQGEIVFRASAAPMFEVACHEGNYALGNILAGARAQEAGARSTK